MDVHTHCTISPARAALGDTVEIKTLDGMREISIPAGFQSGDKITIKGAGVPSITNASVRGNQIVMVNVLTPTHLSNEEKSLYEKLYEIQMGKAKTKKSVKEKLKGAFRG